MSYFSLCQVASIDLPSTPLGLLRLLVEAGVKDMKTTFWDYDEQIDDWANGGWYGRRTLMGRYGNLDDAELHQIQAVHAFDKLIQALAVSEKAELETALLLKSAS